MSGTSIIAKSYVFNARSSESLPSKHVKAGHYWRASETPINCVSLAGPNSLFSTLCGIQSVVRYLANYVIPSHRHSSSR